MKKIISLLFITIIAGFLGYFLGKYGLKSLQNNITIDNKLLLIILIFPLYFLVIGFHEAGHALAGILVKFDFRMYIIGPFHFEKENDKWKFKWNKNLNLAGGMVVCLPISDQNLKKRFMTYIAGGPLASLVLTLIASLTYFLISKTESNSILTLTKQISIIIAFLSFTIFFVTSIPLRGGGFFSDGGRFLRLLRNDKISEMEVLFLKIMSKTSGGTRPRNLNKNDLNKAFDLALEFNDPFKVYLKSYIFQNAFDLGNYEEAEIHLKDYLHDINQIPKSFHGTAWLDASIFYSFAKNDLKTSEDFFEKFIPSSFIPKAQIYLAETLLEKLKNNYDEVKLKKNLAKNELPNMLDRGMALVYQEILNKI